MREVPVPSGSPSSSSVMTARRRDEFGATTSRDSPAAELAGLEEYCEVGEIVFMLVLVGRVGIVCSASFGESANVMKDETSGGKMIRLSCRSLLGIGEGSSSLGAWEGDDAAGACIACAACKSGAVELP